MVGTEFKAMRNKLGLTVGEVADHAGVTQQSIFQFERRKTTARLSTIERNVAGLQAAYEARQERMERVDAIMERLGN